MRQLGDFAAWLGLILIVLGVVYYTPMLVDYVSSDDIASRPKVSVAARPPGHFSGKRNMAMHRMEFERRSHANAAASAN